MAGFTSQVQFWGFRWKLRRAFDTVPGRASSPRPCARTMSPMRRCSSITPVSRWRC